MGVVAAKLSRRGPFFNSSSVIARIQVHGEMDPAKIAWGSSGTDYVVESTGAFTSLAKAEQHIQGELFEDGVDLDVPLPDFLLILKISPFVLLVIPSKKLVSLIFLSFQWPGLIISQAVYCRLFRANRTGSSTSRTSFFFLLLVNNILVFFFSSFFRKDILGAKKKSLDLLFHR